VEEAGEYQLILNTDETKYGGCGTLKSTHWKYAYSNGFNSTKNTDGSFTLLYLYQRKKRHM
jgi:hypothetical protein